MHSWHRIIFIGLFVALTASTFAGVEKQLAGIRLGMKPQEVKEAFGEPTALLIAQPPPKALNNPGGGVSDMLGNMSARVDSMATSALQAEVNSLVFIYQGREMEITASAGTNAASTAMSSPMSPMTKSTANASVELPVWAYVVRALKLSLDQQEFIYQINNTYSLGITITGRGAEAKVTDIVACSFEPFTEVKLKGVTRPAQLKQYNFYYPAKHKQIPAGTSRGVHIGSRLDEVLRLHKWPEVFISYAADEVSRIILDPKGASSKSIPVTLHTYGGATGSVSSAMMGMTPTDMGMGAGNASDDPVGGEKQVTLTDGEDTSIKSGFSRNSLLLYVNDSVALTLVDFRVIRIQIGTGVVRPPEKPKAAATGG